MTVLGQADVILANSRFTASVVARHLPSIAKHINIVYPGINVEAYKPQKEPSREDICSYVYYTLLRPIVIHLMSSDRLTFLTMNRFEYKKNLHLAVSAFYKFRSLDQNLWSQHAGGKRPRLILAGMSLLSLRVDGIQSHDRWIRRTLGRQ